MITRLDDIESHRRFVGWKDATDKKPRQADGRLAENDNSATWVTRSEILEAGLRPGLVLGDVDGTCIVGIDLDAAKDEDGEFDPWAKEIMAAVPTRWELSPSGLGAKALFVIDPADIRMLQDLSGNACKHILPMPGKVRANGSGKAKAPQAEVHWQRTYFTLTGELVPGSSEDLAFLDRADLSHVIDLINGLSVGPRQSKDRTDDSDLSKLVLVVAAIDRVALRYKIEGACLLDSKLAKRWNGDLSGLPVGFPNRIAMSLHQRLHADGFTLAETIAALEMNEATADWMRDKGNQSGYREIVRQRVEIAAKTLHKEDRIDLADMMIDGEAFDEMDLPESIYLIKPWLEQGSLMMIWAETGLGKTWITVELALCLTTGRKFLAWPVTQACHVVYIDGEMKPTKFRKRIRQLNNGKVPANMTILSNEKASKAKQPLDFADRETQENLVEALDAKSLHGAVLVFDNLSSLLRVKDEKDNAEIARFNAFLLELRFLGYSVVLVHHASKAGDQRGGSARKDNLDTVIALKQGGENQGKQRSEGAAFDLSFANSDGGKVRDERPDPITLHCNLVKKGKDQLEWIHDKPVARTPLKTLVLRTLADGEHFSQSDIAAAINKDQGSVSKALRDAKRCWVKGPGRKPYRLTPEGEKYLAQADGI